MPILIECHTCDSSTPCIHVRPDAHTHDSSTPHICILLIPLLSLCNVLLQLCLDAFQVRHEHLCFGCLVLDSIFEFPLLRILRKRELGFSLGSIVTRHW